MEVWDLLIRNVHLATFAGPLPAGPVENAAAGSPRPPVGGGRPERSGLGERGTLPECCGEVRDGALAVQAGRIAWLGPVRDLPSEEAKRTIDGRGGWLLPGFVDCHTHLVYAGNRAQEFEQRLLGASYEEIARSGGGICATVAATRAATEDGLIAESRPRLERLMADGVTTVEIKSGYGLELDAERRLLRAARRLGEMLPVRVVTTFLGAHALPPEYQGRADEYITQVCDVMLPALCGEGLVDGVDAFCETIGFTPDQTRRVFEAAGRLNVPVKLHAEQLSDSGGAALAADFRALSADHLEYLSEDGAAAMARAGTVGVLLPGAFYFLRETHMPPVELLRRLGVPIAVATDCNPGSSPLTSLLLALNMACTLFRLTPAEALSGVTRNAARALGRADEIGTLEVGKRADLALWNVEHPAELCFHLGLNPLRLRVFDGEPNPARIKRQVSGSSGSQMPSPRRGRWST